jgi:hypothetical protein
MDLGNAISRADIAVSKNAETTSKLVADLDATIDRLTGLGRLTEMIDDSLARWQKVVVKLADNMNALEARIERLEHPGPFSLGRPNVIRLADHSNPTKGQSHE